MNRQFGGDVVIACGVLAKILLELQLQDVGEMAKFFRKSVFVQFQLDDLLLELSLELLLNLLLLLLVFKISPN